MFPIHIIPHLALPGVASQLFSTSTCLAIKILLQRWKQVIITGRQF